MSDQLEYAGFEASEFAENPDPRVPCVLLLDTSGSMCEVVGDAGQATGETVVQDGQLYNVVSRGNPGDTKIISVCRVSIAHDGGTGGAKASQGARNFKFFVVALPENA
jgi:hypothetical protein